MIWLSGTDGNGLDYRVNLDHVHQLFVAREGSSPSYTYHVYASIATGSGIMNIFVSPVFTDAASANAKLIDLLVNGS